ncbi:hypothetical protein J4403_03440 [Candidatus Woesearchaeota archaeon]|nr:hypothetical protein [Candidatus Woesearchaeota archaeon]
MRDNEWLNNKLNQIWTFLFPEVARSNDVVIRFKGKSKNRFGSISLKDKTTIITINSLFMHELIPEYVIDTTVAHELVHYMHGFFSPHQRLYKHPHKGGIVTKELKKRGFEATLKKEKLWVKKEWWNTYKTIKTNGINLQEFE